MCYIVIHSELARLAAGIWDKFSMTLDDLKIRCLSNATRERQKWTRFHAGSQLGRLRAFLTIATSESVFFHGHFALICDAFWRHFAWFCAPVWKPDLDIWMVLRATQNAWFSSLFEAYFVRENTVTRDVCSSSFKKRTKLGRKQVTNFGAICIRVSCFLTFSCDLEKNVIRGTICEYPQYNLGFQGPPKNDQKMTLPGV